MPTTITRTPVETTTLRCARCGGTAEAPADVIRSAYQALTASTDRQQVTWMGWRLGPVEATAPFAATCHKCATKLLTRTEAQALLEGLHNHAVAVERAIGDDYAHEDKSIMPLKLVEKLQEVRSATSSAKSIFDHQDYAAEPGPGWWSLPDPPTVEIEAPTVRLKGTDT
jgi:hypothetical protein